jgi:hypothetical protein
MTDKLIRRGPGPSGADARDEIFLTEKQLASRHQLSVKTLRNARVTGSYIRFVRLGRTVRYRKSLNLPSRPTIRHTLTTTPSSVG